MTSSVFALVLEALRHDGGAGTAALDRTLDGARVTLASSDLVEALRDPRSIDEHGVTPLGRAVVKRNRAAVQRLLKVSPLLALDRNEDGETPLMIALRGKDPSMVDALVPVSDLQAREPLFGDSIAELALQYAVEPVLAVLVPTLAARLDTPDDRTLLMIAASKGSPHAVRQTLRFCAVDAQDGEGRTALMLAVDAGLPANVGALLPAASRSVLDGQGYDVLERFAARFSTLDREPHRDDWACLDVLALFEPSHRVVTTMTRWSSATAKVLPLWHDPARAAAARHEIVQAYERPLLQAVLDGEHEALPVAPARARARL